MTGWRDAIDKLVDTSTHVFVIDRPTYICRVGGINRETYLAQHGLPFMKANTLSGCKKSLYILMKIIKKLTDSPAKSYQMKNAVGQVFMNKLPDENDLGSEALVVMKQRDIRGEL